MIASPAPIAISFHYNIVDVGVAAGTARKATNGDIDLVWTVAVDVCEVERVAVQSRFAEFGQ